MAAPKGNNYAEKFKTPEERKALLDAYVAHAKTGLSDEAFAPCDMDTFKEYCKKYPEDFPTDIVRGAQVARRIFWEQLGVSGTAGKLPGFNAKSWEFNMKNRFKWKDRTDVTTDDEKLPGGVVMYVPQPLSEEEINAAADKMAS